MEIICVVAHNALAQEGLVPKSKMSERFASFSQGRWEDLLIQSRDSALGAVQAQVKRRRRAVPTCPDVRAERADRLIQLGELSAADRLSKVTLLHQATMPLSNCCVIQPQAALWLLSWRDISQIASLILKVVEEFAKREAGSSRGAIRDDG